MKPITLWKMWKGPFTYDVHKILELLDHNLFLTLEPTFEHFFGLWGDTHKLDWRHVTTFNTSQQCPILLLFCIRAKTLVADVICEWPQTRTYCHKFARMNFSRWIKCKALIQLKLLQGLVNHGQSVPSVPSLLHQIQITLLLIRAAPKIRKRNAVHEICLDLHKSHFFGLLSQNHVWGQSGHRFQICNRVLVVSRMNLYQYFSFFQFPPASSKSL